MAYARIRDMKIEIIDQLEIFQALKNQWALVYEADRQAQFFLSWTWLFAQIKRCEKQHEMWFILAAKSSTDPSEYVAFFPLKISIYEYPEGGLYSKLSMAGVTDSEHIGFICLPDYEAEVTSAFASYLQKQEEWSVFEVRNIQKVEGRMNLLLKEFLGEDFDLKDHYHKSDFDQIDNNIIPYVSLPNEWEDYLQNILSTNTRQKIRRLLRKIESSQELYVTQVDADNLEHHIEILCKFWRTNWEGRKDPEHCQRFLEYVNLVLHHCFEHQCLYLAVLWQGDRPLGAIANLMDFSHKTVLFFIGGRDDTIKDLPPGIILQAYAIQYAIQNGFKTYDFLMGNEAYKYSFGAQERQIKAVMVRRKVLSNQPPTLNPRTIPEAFQISAIYHRANRLTEAEQGYRQILAVQPQHPDALYGLGVIMQRQGDYPSAEKVFQRLLEMHPHHVKAWFSLATLHQIQDQLSEAEKAYQWALTLQPEPSAIALAIYHNLGYTLQQQGKWDAAIACYEKARELQPDSIEADVIWANALYAQGTLSPDQYAHYAAVNHELGNTRKQAGDFKAAIEYYQQAIAMQPGLAAAHYHLALALQEQGNWEGAIASYQTAQHLQPNYAEAEVGLANVLQAQGLLSPADQVRYATMSHSLGHACQTADDLAGAVAYYQQAILMNPDWAEAHYHLGVVMQKQGNWEAAIVHYQTAQTLQPDSRETEVSWANALCVQGKLAPEKRAHYALMSHDLGNQCKQAGDLAGAIAYYRQAVGINPDFAEARDHLRCALEEQTNVKIKVSCAKRG
jgi:tetratricopeptide (TPR) repeat protein